MGLSAIKNLPDPLEQFEQLYFYCAWFNNLYASVIALTFAIAAFTYSGNMVQSDKISTQSDWTNIQKYFLNYVAEIVNSNLNAKAKIYIPPIYTLFLCIFFSNIIGMVPYAFTNTSTVVVTFFLSLMSFIGVTRIGKKVHKSKLVNITLPKGVPIHIAPLLVVIEFVSFMARAFSLGIRLFANMMSGHSLLKILGGFSFFFGIRSLLTFFISIIPFSVIYSIVGLECVIAFLQAYVFTTLVTIYINDVLNLH